MDKTEPVFRPGRGGIREIIRIQQQEQARAQEESQRRASPPSSLISPRSAR